MNLKKITSPNDRICLVVALTICVLGKAISLSAAPPPKGPVFHNAQRPTHFLRGLPYGYREFLYGGLTYYFFNGHFYHQGPQGYGVVAAPVGATIRFLPPGAVAVTVGVGMYYTLSGVYYQQIPDGYLIVNSPVVVEAPSQYHAEKTDFVRVATAALNVRSGPGIDRPIINQVLEGDVMEVKAIGTDWYYVKLQDETSGWVMKKYTTLLAPKPVG